MRTTLSISDSLLVQARRMAERSGQTLSEFVEDALRIAIKARTRRPKYRLRLAVVRGDRPPKVDFTSRDAFYA